MGVINIHMDAMATDWDGALTLLGEVLEGRNMAPCHLVVCGGAALRAAAIVSRVTRDVDVLAQRGEIDGELSSAYPMSESLKQAVAEVATELNLPANWLNASTSMLIGDLESLPAEVWQDLHEKAYGPRLRISYIGRAGLIVLKFKAAIGRQEGRDLDDLMALAPDAQTCRRAVAWLRRNGMDTASETRLQQILTTLGHGNA